MSVEAQQQQLSALEADKQLYRETSDQISLLDEQYKKLNTTVTKGGTLADKAGAKQLTLELEAMSAAIDDVTKELIKNSDETLAKRSKIAAAMSLEHKTIFELADAYTVLRDAGIDATDEQIARAQDLSKAISGIGEAMSQSESSDMKSYFEALKNGQADAAQGFEMLGKAFLRAIIKGFAAALLQESAFYNAKGIAALISLVDAPAAPGYFAAGAALAAAGAATELGAAQLADGGVTIGGSATEDTIPALLRKNEAVVPLDDPRALAKMGLLGGGGSPSFNITVHGATDPAGTARAVGRAGGQLLQQFDDQQRRQGRRAPIGG